MSGNSLVTLIGADTDPVAVSAVNDATVVAFEAMYETFDGAKRARDVLEGMLCAACSVIQDAPDEATRAALADRAICFIVRNSGMPAAALLSARLARRHAAAIRDRANPLATIKPEGSA